MSVWSGAKKLHKKVDDHWSTGLCSCHKDWENCGFGTLCSGCNTSRTREFLKGEKEKMGCCCGCCLCTWDIIGIPFIHGWFEWKNRKEMAKKYDIGKEELFDCCCSCFCPWFTACQHAREIKERLHHKKSKKSSSSSSSSSDSD
jgi:Cys-rich protein (TIGR01571 family)